MNGNRILQGLIEIYQNDFICGYEGDDKEELRLIFLELIVEVTRYVNNYRYCTTTNCPCSPEFHIKSLLEKCGDQINNKLLVGEYGLSEVPLFSMREFLNEFTKEN